MASFKLLSDSKTAPHTMKVEQAFPLGDAFARLAKKIIVAGYGAVLHNNSHVSLWFDCISDGKFQLITLNFFNHKGQTYFQTSRRQPKPARPYNPMWASNFVYPEDTEKTITVTAPRGALEIDQLEFLDVKIGFDRLVVECRTARLDNFCSLAIVVDTRDPLPQLHCYDTSDTLSHTAVG